MRSSLRSSILSFGLALLLVPVASAQLVPGHEGVSPISEAMIRDGDALLAVHRDARDASLVTATRSGAAALRARVDRHAIVRVAPGVDARAILRALDVLVVREIAPSLRAFRVADARGGDGLDLAVRLAAHAGPGRPLVDAIPDWIVAHETRAIAIPPDDPRYSGQWYLQRIAIEDAWRLGTGDAATTIVIVDSGCDASHPDLAPHLDAGRDVIDGDDDPSPTPGEPGNEHGTACAGLAAAASDNTIGIAGTCPECRLRCVRLLGAAASEVPISADIEAFQFALDVDAAVVSNSWGFVDATPIPAALRAIIEELADSGRGGRGALVLFAAGNDDRELFDYEIEAVRGVITVGATNNFDEATAFSNRGEAVDVVAPTGTLTTDIAGPDGADPGDYTSSFGGTSSSCPVAAGVAGLLASAAPERTGAELSTMLIETARQSPFATPDERGHDALYGYGLIQPASAMRRALGIPEPAPDAGVNGDAGIDAGPPTPPPSGCGCRASSSEGASTLLSLLTLLALLPRSRRRRR